MTVCEFIKSDFLQFGIELSQHEMNALMIDNGIDINTEYDTKIAKKAIVGYIPKLLLRPDISEGGMSLKYNLQSIQSYYGILCAELGIENKLIERPKVKNRSNVW